MNSKTRNFMISTCILVLCSVIVTAQSSTHYYAGSNVLAVKDDAGAVSYLFQDRLGSDINSKSLPFGQVISSADRFGFTGKEQDASGLHYFSARYYDSSIGRFTSVDPVPSEPSYQYVRNNPLYYIDTDGHQSTAALVLQNSLSEFRIRYEALKPTISTIASAGKTGLAIGGGIFTAVLMGLTTKTMIEEKDYGGLAFTAADIAISGRATSTPYYQGFKGFFRGFGVGAIFSAGLFFIEDVADKIIESYSPNNLKNREVVDELETHFGFYFGPRNFQNMDDTRDYNEHVKKKFAYGVVDRWTENGGVNPRVLSLLRSNSDALEHARKRWELKYIHERTEDEWNINQADPHPELQNLENMGRSMGWIKDNNIND